MIRRFLPWLLPIVLLLVAVPVLLAGGFILPAKMAGVLVVVLTAVAIRYWLFQASKKRVEGEKVNLTINERYFLKEQSPYYSVLSGTEKKLLEERAGLLLVALSFDHFDHSDPDKNDCVAFAIVLGLLSRHLSYSSMKGKVVVFREEAAAELAIQDGKQLLFVSLKELLAALRASRTAAIEEVMVPDTAKTLLLFCQG